jgi:hypothetical protein
MKTKYWLLSLMVLIVYALHQDVWNWHKAGPLVFGMLPPGLVYHLGYSVVAAITMAVLVKYAWPAHLEDETEKPQAPDSERP